MGTLRYSIRRRVNLCKKCLLYLRTFEFDTAAAFGANGRVFLWCSVLWFMLAVCTKRHNTEKVDPLAL